MEPLLLFFVAGLCIFLGRLTVKSERTALRLFAFVGSGILAGILIDFAVGPPWPPAISIPRGGSVVVTTLAGVVLYAADRGKLINRPGIRYFATILLGLVLAGLSYVSVRLYGTLAGVPYLYLAPRGSSLLLLVLTLVGFLTVFGYTFPERWFKQRQMQRKIE